jgi:hypothetical protein
VPPGGFAQAVTTTTIIAAPVTVAGTIAPVSTAVTNNTVNNSTVNTVNNVVPPLPAIPFIPSVGAGAGAAATFDICVNFPGNQPSVPPGLVLTFARNGSLVCVTPGLAKILNPTATKVTVPVGGKLVIAKRGGLLCLGTAAKKPLTVPATMTIKKVFSLAMSGKLVCLKP